MSEDAFSALRAAAVKEGIPTVRGETLRLLLAEIAARMPQKILEIGTAVGVSGAAMLRAAEGAKLVTIEKNAVFAARARENFRALGLEKRVTLFEGDADEIVPELSGSYDFILLDGPKGKYFSYLPDLKALLKVGGTLFADDVSLKFYGLKHTERRNRTARVNMARFVAAVKGDADFSVRIFEEEDGALVAEKIR